MTSVTIGRPTASPASRSQPSAVRPCPWNADGDVRGLKTPPLSAVAPARATAFARRMTCSGDSTAHGPAMTARSPPPTAKAPAVTTVAARTSVARGASLRRGGGTWSGAGPSQTRVSPAFGERPAAFASAPAGTIAKPPTGAPGRPGSMRISAPASCRAAARRVPENRRARTEGSASDRRATVQKRVAFGFTSETSSSRTTSPASRAASSEHTAARGPPSSATRRAANAVSCVSTGTASRRERRRAHCLRTGGWEWISRTSSSATPGGAARTSRTGITISSCTTSALAPASKTRESASSGSTTGPAPCVAAGRTATSISPARRARRSRSKVA